MMKKILSVAAAMVMAITSLTGAMSVSAVDVVATGACGDSVTWLLDSDGVLTISGTGNMYGINERYTYTYSKWTYSSYADQIKEVVIEEGVTSIGPCAFGRTSSSSIVTDEVAYPNLTKISLPSTIEVIGQGAFLATVIKQITVPENVKTIQSHAFQYSLIESLTIGDGTILEACSFSYCRNLKEVTIGANCTYTHGAGWGSENHAESIFDGCNALEKVTILGAGTVGQRFTTIEKGLPDTMFYGCTALKEVRILAKDLEYVGKVNESNVNTETFPAKGTNTVQYSTKINYYVYKDSTTESTLRKAGYFTDENVTYFTETEALETAISNAEEIDKTKYTAETVSVLDSALDNAKAVLENPDAAQEEVDNAVTVIEDAIKGLVEKPTEPEPTELEPTKSEPSINPTTKTPGKTTVGTKATRSKEAVKKDKTAAQKAMKQAKLTSLKVKSKAKKKISVSWKKVKKSKGYQVQVSAKKNFKKVIFKKDLKKTKLTIKNKKIKSKKKYYVRVRAYATYKDANNKTVKVYSKWNKQIRKVKVK